MPCILLVFNGGFMVFLHLLLFPGWVIVNTTAIYADRYVLQMLYRIYPFLKKKKSVIGIAVIDKNHCLPYAKKINCIVCEEHCPVEKKAIRLEEVMEKDYKGRLIKLKRPYVIEELCIGCGICENKCPVEGKAAIEVFHIKNKKVG